MSYLLLYERRIITLTTSCIVLCVTWLKIEPWASPSKVNIPTTRQPKNSFFQFCIQKFDHYEYLLFILRSLPSENRDFALSNFSLIITIIRNSKILSGLFTKFFACGTFFRLGAISSLARLYRSDVCDEIMNLTARTVLC